MCSMCVCLHCVYCKVLTLFFKKASFFSPELDFLENKQRE